MPMLDVPGAQLYYEVAGTGPALLLVTGAPGDATAFAGVVPALADRYTVVTYDPRGYTRFAAGADLRWLLCHQSAARLAEQYGTPLVEFPGDHQAPMARPGEFAEAAFTGNVVEAHA